MAFTHCLIIVDDYAVCSCVGGDILAEGFAYVFNNAVEVIILVAVEVLEKSVIVEAEGVANVTLANLLGFECTDADNQITRAMLALKLPRNTVNFGENGSCDVWKVEFERRLVRVVFVDNL